MSSAERPLTLLGLANLLLVWQEHADVCACCKLFQAERDDIVPCEDGLRLLQKMLVVMRRGL